MLIRFVLIGKDFKFLLLSTSLNINCLCLSFLLRIDCCDVQLSKFQFCFYPKQCLTSLYKCSGKWQRHISCFYILNNLIFIALIPQFHFVFEIETGFGVVFRSYFQLCTYLPNDIHLYFFLKIESRVSS